VLALGHIVARAHVTEVQRVLEEQRQHVLVERRATSLDAVGLAPMLVDEAASPELLDDHTTLPIIPCNFAATRRSPLTDSTLLQRQYTPAGAIVDRS
jgi:hypothetical protein